MAFISLIMAYLAIAIVVMTLVFIIGIVILIVGIVRKCSPKNKGKKSPVVCIILGVLIALFPVVMTLILIISSVSSAVSDIINPPVYDNITDKWRNEWVSDSTAAKEAIQVLLTTADEGDKDGFSEIFTPEIQGRDGFSDTVDAFFESYPVGLSACELKGGNAGSESSFDYGHNVSSGGAYYTCMLGEEWYCISMTFCYENTDAPEKVGIERVIIENLEANAKDEGYPEKTYLACSIISEEEITARLISDNGFIFTPTPERKITEEEMKNYLASCKDLRLLALEIGEPNASKKYSNSTGYNYYYELVPENGEPRYAYICASGIMGKPIYSYVCSDRETIYDKKLYSKNAVN